MPAQPPTCTFQQQAECLPDPGHPTDIPALHKVSLGQLLAWQLHYRNQQNLRGTLVPVAVIYECNRGVSTSWVSMDLLTIIPSLEIRPGIAFQQPACR